MTDPKPLPLSQDRRAQHIPLYFNCIDAVRVLAALAVVVFHYHHFYLADYLDRGSVPAKSEFPYAETLRALYAHGDKAVELFWIISGFVFSHVYLGRSTTLGRFAVARFVRLYPLHFATLMLVLVLQWVSLNHAGHWQIYGNNTPRYFLAQLVMGSQWTTLSLGLSFNGPIWSVSLEIGAYFLFFYALSVLRRFRIWAAFALVVLSWGIPVWFGTRIPLIQSGVFYSAGYFFCGVVLYFGFCRFADRGVVLLGAVMALLLAGAMSPDLGLKTWADVAYGSAVVLAAALFDRRFGESAVLFRSMGNISYSLYLMHVPLQMAVLLAADVFFDGTRAFATHPATLPAYLTASVFLAVLAFRYFERPAGSYCRKVLSR